MGYSCAAAAHDTMQRWIDFCVKASGSQNVYSNGGSWFMFEWSNREHNDGAITGSIHRFEADPRGRDSTFATRVGTFRIDGDGIVTRAPKILRKL